MDWPLSAESRRRHSSCPEKELSGEGEWEALSRAEIVLAPLWLRWKLLSLQSSERMKRPAAGVGRASAGSRNPEPVIGRICRDHLGLSDVTGLGRDQRNSEGAMHSPMEAILTCILRSTQSVVQTRNVMQ